MGTKEGSPKLALARVPYQPLRRTSTLPPEDRTSTSGKFAAVVAKIPGLAAVHIEESVGDNDELSFVQMGELTEEERIAVAQKNLKEWLEQFSEFNELDDKTQESFFRNLFDFTEKENGEVSDENLKSQFEHLLAIKKGDELNISRKYFQQAAEKSGYLDFYIQHFKEWNQIPHSDKKDLRQTILDFLTGNDPMPSNGEVAAFIRKAHEQKDKKNAIINHLKTINEDSVPQAAKHVIQLYMEKIIDENPDMDLEKVISQVGQLIFNIAQERMRYHQGKSTASSVSQDLRLVAAVLDTHAEALHQLSPIEDMRATLPEVPSAKFIESQATRVRATIPAAPMAISGDKDKNPKQE